MGIMTHFEYLNMHVDKNGLVNEWAVIPFPCSHRNQFNVYLRHT